MHTYAIRSLAIISAFAVPLSNLDAQQIFRNAEISGLRPTPLAASAPTSVPALVPYSGFGEGTDGIAVTGEVAVTFLIYKDEVGGQPLFTETQTATFDMTGHYAVQLGSTLSSGIPINLFGTGEARWLEVQIAGAKTQPRSLLVSVPYALKAGDATTLGGLPASAYALAGSSTALQPIMASPDAITSNAVTAVTTTGGTSGQLPLFSGASTVVNSMIYQNTTGIGINRVPAATLDINGTVLFRGDNTITPASAITATKGSASHALRFTGGAYNSSTKAAVEPYFQLQSEPSGNNTASPAATFNLLYNTGTASTPSETGFYINPNGTIHFATAQTFPTASGAGTITGVKTAAPLTGSATSGAVTIGLDVAELETTLNPVYAGLATTNAFKSSATFAGPITGNSGSAAFGVEGMSTGTGGIGVDGHSTGNGGIGVYGNASGAANGSTLPIGVLAHAVQGYGMKSSVDESMVSYASILGQSNGASGAYNQIVSDTSVSAGVWGDIADNSSVEFSVGVVGTTDNGWAGYYANNSSTYPTIEAYNYNSGNVGTLSETFKAGGPGGTCGISGQGNLSCTGQVKTLVSTRSGERTVEAYAVQSPENWMEDFGVAELRDGSATITIDPAFAETVSGSTDYHVFLTPRGDSKGLYVTNLTPTTFEVRESGSGSASIGFDYRIVAKRRGFEAQRLTDVTESFKREMAVKPGRIKGAKLVVNTVP